MIKKYNCGELSLKNIDESIELNGWVSKVRKLGSLIFIDLRDRYGITQLIFKSNSEFYALANSLKNEYVLNIIGKVFERKVKNKALSTGEIEIYVDKLKIWNESKLTPFIISDETDALEDTRLMYRYLDLRRPSLQKKIILKSKFINFISNYLENKNFINTETPILTRSTPEGARDFLVPSRINKNKFFALPQSPQLFKQLLMAATFDKYYQIAKCFRDEDLRSDRQPEFLQLDLEMSFIEKHDIMKLIEDMMKKFIFNIKNIQLEQFPIIKYKDAIDKYGSDKPDIRYTIFLNNLNHIFKESSFVLFKKIIKENNFIRGIYINKIFSNSEFKKLCLIAKQNHAKTLVYIEFDAKLKCSGPINSFLTDFEKQELIKIFEIKKLGTVLIVAEEYFVASQALGAIRKEAAKMANIINENKLSFLWVIDWPMFEYDNQNKKIQSMHHPFTSPNKTDFHLLENNNIYDVKADAYDLVLNGFEIGGGSIRIHQKIIQQKIFEILGLSKQTINNQFGWFLKAFDYGLPPHGGIALGIDRIIMILTNSNSIRDTIPFPKNTNSVDLTSNAPDYVLENQLNELNIGIKNHDPKKID